jgi:hypothetical protein
VLDRALANANFDCRGSASSLREFRGIDRPSEGSTHTRRDGAWAIVRGPYFNQPEDCFHAGYAYPVSGVCELIGMPLANTEPDAPGVVPQSIGLAKKPNAFQVRRSMQMHWKRRVLEGAANVVGPRQAFSRWRCPDDR